MFITFSIEIHLNNVKKTFIAFENEINLKSKNSIPLQRNTSPPSPPHERTPNAIASIALVLYAILL